MEEFNPTICSSSSISPMPTGEPGVGFSLPTSRTFSFPTQYVFYNFGIVSIKGFRERASDREINENAITES